MRKGSEIKFTGILIVIVAVVYIILIVKPSNSSKHKKDKAQAPTTINTNGNPMSKVYQKASTSKRETQEKIILDN